MHLVNTFGVGGMEVGICKLVNALSPNEFSSSVCSTRPADSLKHRLNTGIPLFEFNRREGNDLRLVRQLYGLMKRERPHILHTHRWATLLEGLVAARLAGVPCIVHGEHGTLETRSHNAMVQRFTWNRVNRVLSVSSRLAERMSRDIGFPLERIQVIRNGVDIARYSHDHRAEARVSLGIAADRLVLGTVGRLVPVKDQATLLEAFAILQRDGLAFTGLIAGIGPLLEPLTQHASALGLLDVRFLGNRADVERVLGAMDVFALTSESEGLSNTIQEAMATGLPVVATDVGGTDELVVPEQTGLLVAPKSPVLLAAALSRVARDPALAIRLGQAGRARAEEHFALQRMIREYADLYRELGERHCRQGGSGSHAH